MGPSLTLHPLPRPSTSTAGAFACPLCGETMADDRDACPRCGGNLVRPRENAEVYLTVVPMCGPQCDLQLFEPTPDDSAADRATGPIDPLLAGLSWVFEELLPPIE